MRVYTRSAHARTYTRTQQQLHLTHILRAWHSDMGKGQANSEDFFSSFQSMKTKRTDEKGLYRPR